MRAHRPSGSGKTTLVNLLARFWDVDEGRVTIGGADVQSGTAESLLENISMVFQNVYLSTTPWRTTSGSASPVRHMRKWSRLRSGRAATTSSWNCPKAMTRCSRKAGRAFRAASGSASPSRAHHEGRARRHSGRGDKLGGSRKRASAHGCYLRAHAGQDPRHHRSSAEHGARRRSDTCRR